MRAPQARDTAIDARRYQRWISRFGAYRDGVTNNTIDSWFSQFKAKDADLAARLLDVVEFYSQTNIATSYRNALASIPGWNLDELQRTGKWRFAAMSGSAGESGNMMLYNFRVANRLDGKAFNPLFVERSELFRQRTIDDPERLGPDDVVVLIDDFSGTGKQVCDAWNDPVTSFGALLAEVGTVYLVLVASSRAAREKILRDTELRLVTTHELTAADDILSSHCTHFTAEDRAAILRYCKKADSKRPRGFGNCGFVVVFQHRPPNNTIPILTANHGAWLGLFPRHYAANEEED